MVLGFFFRDIEMMFSCSLPETKIANHPKILGLVQIQVMSFLLGCLVLPPGRCEAS